MIIIIIIKLLLDSTFSNLGLTARTLVSKSKSQLKLSPRSQCALGYHPHPTHSKHPKPPPIFCQTPFKSANSPSPHPVLENSLL